MNIPHGDRDAIRQAYVAFKRGARLNSHDVERLLAARGIVLTNNALRELSRDSDRGASCSAVQLHALISAWADEQRKELR